MYVCMYVYTHTYIYMYIHTYTHIHMFSLALIHTGVAKLLNEASVSRRQVRSRGKKNEQSSTQIGRSTAKVWFHDA